MEQRCILWASIGVLQLVHAASPNLDQPQRQDDVHSLLEEPDTANGGDFEDASPLGMRCLKEYVDNFGPPPPSEILDAIWQFYKVAMFHA